jgi:Bacterial SCP ortholog
VPPQSRSGQSRSGQRRIDPHEARAAVEAVAAWLSDGTVAEPSRPELASAVRLTLKVLATAAPGRSVEVRVPPFAAIQCIEGPRHTRGTPPNVVQTDPRTWLLLATGRLTWPAAVAAALVTASGTRAPEIAQWLPLVRA